MSIAEQRAEAVSRTIDRIRAVAAKGEITRAALDEIKAELMTLAAEAQLFPGADFPPPEPESGRSSCLYRLAEDDDHTFALYANAARSSVDTPAHNHTTWAVIVGVRGEELNRFYRRDGDGVEVTGETVVKPGTGVAFLPDDLHSIHIHGQDEMLNFHMYGLALEQLHERTFYDAKTGSWRTFPAHSDIREARGR